MGKFKSRKFWMALVSAGLLLCNKGLDLGIDEETVLGFAGIVISYVVAQGVVDARSEQSK